MKKVVKIDLSHPDPALERGADEIKKGNVIIFPTDTLYGIVADIYHSKAIDKIFRIKKRESEKPILILVENPGDIIPLVKKIPLKGAQLIEQYWPGPLTLIFEARDFLPPQLTGKTGTIGIRCPNSPLVRRLLFFTKGPVTATSANLSHESPCQDASQAEKLFGRAVDLILDGGTCISEPSTIVDLTGDKMRILREGKIKL